MKCQFITSQSNQWKCIYFYHTIQQKWLSKHLSFVPLFWPQLSPFWWQSWPLINTSVHNNWLFKTHLNHCLAENKYKIIWKAKQMFKKLLKSVFKPEICLWSPSEDECGFPPTLGCRLCRARPHMPSNAFRCPLSSLIIRAFYYRFVQNDNTFLCHNLWQILLQINTKLFSIWKYIFSNKKNKK